MKGAVAVSASLVSAITLVGCSATPIPQPHAEAPTPTLCVDSPELVGAIDTLLKASNDQSAVQVYGEAGGGANNLFDLMQRTDLAAMDNPKGAGVIVSVVYGGGGAFARDTAHRAGWLVLDGAVYPIDVDAAQAFGLLWDGYPDSVQQSAGLSQNYLGMDEAYGIEDFVSYNADTVADYYAFINAANELCESPTFWG